MEFTRPNTAMPSVRDLPECLHDHADADLARRSLFSAAVYFLAWLLLMAFTDCLREQPILSSVCGILLAVIGFGRFLLMSRFEAWHARNPRLWRQSFSQGALLSALAWTVLCAALVARHGLDGSSMMAMLATTGMAAGGTTSLAPRLRATRFFLLILLLPLVAATLLRNEALSHGVALMIILYLVFLWLAGRRLHDEYWRALANGWLLDRRAAELEQARDRAMAAAQAKDEFLATMSHELRTPLNAILGFSELMSDGHSGPLEGEQSEYMALITASGRHLLALINDILDLAKSDAGRLEMDTEVLDADELCRTSLNLVRAQALEKSLALEYGAPPRPLRLIGDKRRLCQILVNLLGNAVKFTPERGRVSLSVQDSGTEVRFIVEDTGIGISPENQKKLFQPFVQLDSGITRQYGGTGLGLALSQRLAHLHHGNLEVDSTPGRGSRFSLTMPCSI